MKLQLAADQLPPQHPSLVLQSFESCAVGGDDQGVNSKFLHEQDVELITGRSGSGTSGVRDQCRTHPNSLSTAASTDLADATRAAAASPLHLSIAAGSDHIVSKGSNSEAGRSSAPAAAAAAAAAVHQVHCYGKEEPHTNMEDQREVLGVESCSRHTKESSEPHIMREQEDVDLGGGDIQSRHVRDVTVQANDFQTWRYQQDQQLRTAGAAVAALAGRRDKLDSEPTAAQCVSLEGAAAAPYGVMYRECQKNLAADQGVCAIDGCGEFMPSGREGKNALTCAACGCHRNFHRRVQLAWDHHDQGGKDDHDDMEQQQLHEKEGAGENEHVTSICKIERVAHELMAAASRTIPLLSQELPYLSHHHQNHHAAGRVEDLFIRERNVMAKISVENLDHIAKLMLSTAEYLTLLQKISSSTTTMTHMQHITASSHEQAIQEDKEFDVGAASPPSPLPCVAEQGPLSSDVSPVSTVEKRSGPTAAAPIMSAMPLYLQPCNTGAGRIGAAQALSLASHQHHHQHHHATVVNTTQGVSVTGGLSSQRLFLERGSTGGASELAAATRKFKRKRTHITEEQRYKLNLFAERAGWTVVGQRKETIDAACTDIGIEPKTLKYWIHNSKQKFKRELSSEQGAMQGGH